jgi:hypothetical protein
MPVEVYYKQVVAKLILHSIPSEIYDGYQAEFVKILSFAPQMIRLLKKRFRVDDFAKN